MDKKVLGYLGFKDTSFNNEGCNFTEYTLIHEDGFTIQISGLCLTEILIDNKWITVPSCTNTTDVVKLINLFKLPF